MKIKNLIHYGDMLAIPFFCLLIYYFIKKDRKNLFEIALLSMCIIALICDILFTIYFLSS